MNHLDKSLTVSEARHLSIKKSFTERHVSSVSYCDRTFRSLKEYESFINSNVKLPKPKKENNKN